MTSLLLSRYLQISPFLASINDVLVHYLDTGMVNIYAPPSQVCYLSTPELQCTFEEPTGSAGWNLTTVNSRFELNNGIVVQINNTCATDNYPSCIGVKLVAVTGIWRGKHRQFISALNEILSILLNSGVVMVPVFGVEPNKVVC